MGFPDRFAVIRSFSVFVKIHGSVIVYRGVIQVKFGKSLRFMNY